MAVSSDPKSDEEIRAGLADETRELVKKIKAAGTPEEAQRLRAELLTETQNLTTAAVKGELVGNNVAPVVWEIVDEKLDAVQRTHGAAEEKKGGRPEGEN